MISTWFPGWGRAATPTPGRSFLLFCTDLRSWVGAGRGRLGHFGSARPWESLSARRRHDAVGVVGPLALAATGRLALGAGAVWLMLRPTSTREAAYELHNPGMVGAHPRHGARRAVPARLRRRAGRSVQPQAGPCHPRGGGRADAAAQGRGGGHGHDRVADGAHRDLGRLSLVPGDGPRQRKIAVAGR